ncbi:hypothetical protein AB0J52_07790 [Spirillospora sp. NPDC049652]
MSRVKEIQGRDRGASSLEYGALIMLGAAALAVLVLSVSTMVQPNVRAAICRMFGGSCAGSGQATGPRKPTFTKCNVDDTNRSMGFNASFRGIRGDQAGKDGIVTQVDPVTGERSAQVTLTGKSGVGVETGDRTDIPGIGKLGQLNEKLKQGNNGKVNVSAFAGMNNELAFRYDFAKPDSQGNDYADAKRFLDSRRGALWQRLLSGLGGANGEAAENGAAYGAHLIKKGWYKLLGKDTSKLDAQEGQTPNAVTFRVGGEVSGGVGYSNNTNPPPDEQKKRLFASLGISAEGKFTSSSEVTVTLDDKAHPENNGSRVWATKFSLDANGKVQGGFGVNAFITPEIKGILEGGGTITGTQTVTFDRNGNPTRFNIQFDKEVRYAAGLTGSLTKESPEPAKKGEGKTKLSGGHRWSQIQSLDLTNPENRAAFDKVFATPAGMTAVPKIGPNIFDNLQALGKRMGQHGQEVRYEYDTSGNTNDLSGSNGEKGIKRKGFGIGWSNENTWAKYRSGKYFDHEAPQFGWQNLAKCPRG